MSTDFQFFSFTFGEVAPDVSEVLDFLRSSDSEEEHPVRTIIDDILSELSSYNEISGGYQIKEIENLNVKEGILTVDEIGLNIGSQISGYIKGSSQVALFICTAGEIFTRLSRMYNEKGDFLESYIADSIGSLTVEKAMDKIQESLAESMLKDGLNISNRYSPGYCNWHLSDQRNLFQLIGNNPVGITLSDSSLMTPIKSVSGIIGIGEKVRKRAYGCTVCNNATCIYRKLLTKNIK